MHFTVICSISMCPLFQCVHLKCKSAPKFHLSFWYYGSYISVFGNFPIPLKKMERKFDLNCFDSFCQLNYQYNEVRCMKTTQIVHSNLHLFLHFQWTILNIAIYCNMNRIAMHPKINLLWHMYRGVYHIVKFYLIPTTSCEVVLLLCQILQSQPKPLPAPWKVNKHHSGRNKHADWKGKWKLSPFYIEFVSTQKLL